MSGFWLGDVKLDRFVSRSLRPFINGAGVSELRVAVCRRLWEEGAVADFQILPDENDIWQSLQRLVLKGRVDKYVAETKVVDRAIRYRINARK